MARRVPLAINAFYCLIILGCSNSPGQVESYNIRQLDLKIINGVAYNRCILFTGNVYELTKAGDSVFSKSFKDGVEDGPQKTWYPNKKLQELRWYKDGKKTGINLAYWPNGRLRYKYRFINDMYEGVQFEWHFSGKAYSKKNYAAGHESGSQQSWNEDGTIRSNYEARNGRNYGNIGRKNCYSVYADSAFHSIN